MKLNRRLSYLFATLLAITAIFISPARAQVLFQEGFNYTSGSNLGANAPWGGGSSANLAVGSGNLTYSGLVDQGGNDLVVTSGAAAVATNIFGAGITSGTAYISFLVDATALPTTASALISASPYQYVLDLNAATILPFYTEPNGAGWSIGVAGLASGFSANNAVYESAILAANETYLVVGEYNFSSFTANLYINPVPGAAQPATPSATLSGTKAGKGGVQSIDVVSQSSAAGGSYILDNFTVGQTWSDVTPAAAPEPSTLGLAALGLLGLAVHSRRARR